MKWLNIRLTGKAQVAFKRLSEEDQADYKKAKKALGVCFEPQSRRQLYVAELQTKRKKRTESWAEFANDLKLLVDKANPNLQAEAREELALVHYLGQLSCVPQIAFSVKQKRPTNVDEAVAATLEMEAYLVPCPAGVAATTVDETTEVTAAAAVRTADTTLDLVRQLVERMEKLETQFRQQRTRTSEYRGRQRSPRARFQGARSIVCRRCGKTGHYERGCAEPRNSRQQQGN